MSRYLFGGIRVRAGLRVAIGKSKSVGLDADDIAGGFGPGVCKN